MFDAADTVGKSLRILQGVITTLKVSRRQPGICRLRGPPVLLNESIVLVLSRILDLRCSPTR